MVTTPGPWEKSTMVSFRKAALALFPTPLAMSLPGPSPPFGPDHVITTRKKASPAAKQVYQQIYKPKDPGPDDWTKKLVFGPGYGSTRSR